MAGSVEGALQQTAEANLIPAEIHGSSFWGRHKVKILKGTAIVAVITSVALAVLCWPVSFGLLGAWVIGHGIALVAWPIVAKIAIVAAGPVIAGVLAGSAPEKRSLSSCLEESSKNRSSQEPIQIVAAGPVIAGVLAGSAPEKRSLNSRLEEPSQNLSSQEPIQITEHQRICEMMQEFFRYRGPNIPISAYIYLQTIEETKLKELLEKYRPDELMAGLLRLAEKWHEDIHSRIIYFLKSLGMYERSLSNNMEWRLAYDWLESDKGKRAVERFNLIESECLAALNHTVYVPDERYEQVKSQIFPDKTKREDTKLRNTNALKMLQEGCFQKFLSNSMRR